MVAAETASSSAMSSTSTRPRSASSSSRAVSRSYRFIHEPLHCAFVHEYPVLRTVMSSQGGTVHFVETEIISQPDCWRRAVTLAPDSLPAPGERVAVIGCGTSWFVAQSYAQLREAAGHGETDAFAA